MPQRHDPDTHAPDALCIGETMALIAPVDGKPLATTEHIALLQAGAESNVARYLTELGVPAAWLGALGEDPLGDRIIGELAGSGVDVRWVHQRKDAPTGVFFKDPGPDGTRVHYYRSRSAAGRMSAADLDRWPLNDASWVHLTGITPALSASCALMTEVLLERTSGGAMTSFDVNYRAQLWPDRATAAHRLRELARQADVVLVGRDEAEELWGTSTPEQIAEVLDGPRSVVVKDADREAVEIRRSVSGPARITRVPAHQIEVVEPVGAGDAFAAGYIAATLRGEDAVNRPALGHSVAAWTLGTVSDYRPGHGQSVQPTSTREHR